MFKNYIVNIECDNCDKIFGVEIPRGVLVDKFRKEYPILRCKVCQCKTKFGCIL